MRRVRRLDQALQQACDRLVRLAADLLEVPTAMVAFVEEDRDVVLSGVGLPEPLATTREVPPGPSFCERVIETGAPVSIADARSAPDAGPERGLRKLGLVSYVGVPLTTREGHGLGALCAMDEVPRAWTAREVRLLTDLAASVMTEIELHDALRTAEEAREEAAAQRARYSSLVEGLDAIVWEMDGRTWSFTYVSPRAEDILGYPRERWLRAPNLWLEIVHPEDREWAETTCRNALRQGLDHEMEYRVVAADGRTVWIHDVARIMRDPDGGVSGARGVMLDISDRKRAEEALRESERTLHSLVHHLPGMVYRCRNDPVRSMELVSEGSVALTGYQPSELMEGGTVRFADLIHPEDRPAVRRQVQEALEHGQHFQVTYRILARDGRERWLWEQGQAVHAKDGEPRLEGLILDITEQRRAEAALRRSEERLALALEGAQQGLWDWNLATNEVYFSPHWERMLGYEPGQVDPVASSWARMVHPDDLPHVMEVLQAHFRGETPLYETEHRMLHRQGHWVWILDRGRVLERDAQGRPLRMAGTHTDVSERKRTEHALRESEERFRQIAENFQDIFWLLELDRDSPGRNRVLYASPSYERIWGRSRESLYANPWRGMEDVHPEDRDRAVDAFSEAVRTGYGQAEYRITRSDGATCWLATRYFGVVNEEGEVYRVAGVTADVTDELARERQLRRAERLASVGTLIGGVAHELNNPLHAIRSFAELMRMEERSPDDREALEVIQREADRAAKIVADLRLIARETQEEGARAAVDLGDVARHVLKIRRYALETGGVEVREELAADLPPVLANRSEIEQVVLNLVVNAEQAMAGQEGPKRLVIRTTRAAEGASLQVVDSGPGIAPEHLEHIFDPFFTTKSPGEGTGLGLSLAHSIVTEHGGQIQVDSEPGRGTAFRVDLPRAPAPERPSGEEVRRDDPPARSVRILVVDDEAAIRRVLTRFLERLGHRVDAAADGREALRLLEEEEYDLILSDLRMPGLDGEQLLARLRDRGGNLQTRLIFVTGDAASAQAARVISGARVPVLLKPLRLEDLARAVERATSADGPGTDAER